MDWYYNNNTIEYKVKIEPSDIDPEQPGKSNPFVLNFIHYYLL